MTDYQKPKVYFITAMANLLEATCKLKAVADREQPELSNDFEQLISLIQTNIGKVEKSESPVDLIDEIITKCRNLDERIRTK